MRYLLLDQITDVELGKRATGTTTLSMSEDFLAQHFPRFPIMPGLLIIEAMVQLGSWLIASTTNFNKKALLEHVESAKFRRFARPGNTVHIEANLKKMEEACAYFQGVARVEKEVITEASFSTVLVPLQLLENPEEAKHIFKYHLCGEYYDYLKSLKMTWAMRF